MIRFRIFRTSINGINKPCDEAIAVEHITTQRQSMLDVDSSVSGGCMPFFAAGRNHRMEGAQWVRDMPRTEWVVEFSNLQDLLAFTAKYGDVTVSNEGVPTVTIMDGIEVPEDWD